MHRLGLLDGGGSAASRRGVPGPAAVLQIQALHRLGLHDGGGSGTAGVPDRVRSLRFTLSFLDSIKIAGLSETR